MNSFSFGDILIENLKYEGMFEEVLNAKIRSPEVSPCNNTRHSLRFELSCDENGNFARTISPFSNRFQFEKFSFLRFFKNIIVVIQIRFIF